jgi:hypothetical protein
MATINFSGATAQFPPGLTPDHINYTLKKVAAFLCCVQETIKADGTNNALAASRLLLEVENDLYDLRLAINPTLDDGQDEQGGAS